MVGLPVGKLILITCFLGGSVAGLAGMVEVAAVQERANASLIAAMAIPAFSCRSGAAQSAGHRAGGDPAGRYRRQRRLLQRHLGLPDAATIVLQGILFIVILASEVAYGRINLFQKKKAN